jgi:flagellar biosynthesis/type III secretory pathway protein FliH
VNAPRRPPDPAGVISWSPDELELDGVPFGGAPLAQRPTQHHAAEVALATQQAVDDAFSQGYDAGREAGAAEERARLESAMLTVSSLLTELREREARWMERMQDNICALSVAVGRNLYDAELQTAGSHTVSLVRRALTEFPIDQPVTIRIHPTDLASITASAVAEGAPLTVGRAEAQWIPDPRVMPGGCVVEGRDRIIDGRVDTALERLYRRLTGTGA